MHRSLAQQIEHWAALGRALEAAGVTMPQVLALLGSDLRARERVLLKLGLASPESMYLLPASIVAKTQVHFPELRKKPELQKK